LKAGHRAPPGDDAAPVPPPLDRLPPAGQCCDLVLTGGVASGVVYPWAILEIARAYHFRSIAGTSVGAMAAALAAAAEYGRCHGHERAFEPLRRAPEQLAEVLPDGRTRMLSLFQPRAAGRRLLGLFVTWLRRTAGGSQPRKLGFWCTLAMVLRAYAVEAAFGALCGLATLAGVLFLLGLADRYGGWAVPSPLGFIGVALYAGLAGIGAFGSAALAVWRTLCRELRQGLVDHHFGLCAGAASDVEHAPQTGVERDRPGLTDWLHEGVQRSAGRTLDEPPLTFRDLWRAPVEPGSARRGGDAVADRAIDLVVITTSVTQMRPLRLPNLDRTQRLFFDPQEWDGFFPPMVMDALRATAPRWVHAGDDEPRKAPCSDLRELPGADLPLVVAARLSLSFPVLFCAVPLYAIDFDAPRPKRAFRRVWFSDGGLCSNFPIHLFDEALPPHPTFGLWLDQRQPEFPDDDFWLPGRFLDGVANGMVNFDRKDDPSAGPWARLAGFVGAALATAKDWGDRTTMRMPQTRHRVARLNLRDCEGALNIAMERTRIMHMAQTYGTVVGQAFVERWRPAPGPRPSPEWDRQRWLRFRVLVPALRRMLLRFERSADGHAGNTPLAELIRRAVDTDLLRAGDAARLTPAQADAWQRAAAALATLEEALRDPAFDAPLPGPPGAEPELRLRPPI
jgi:predicted acylesterase/phospholipase RssA